LCYIVGDCLTGFGVRSRSARGGTPLDSLDAVENGIFAESVPDQLGRLVGAIGDETELHRHNRREEVVIAVRIYRIAAISRGLHEQLIALARDRYLQLIVEIAADVLVDER